MLSAYSYTRLWFFRNTCERFAAVQQRQFWPGAPFWPARIAKFLSRRLNSNCAGIVPEAKSKPRRMRNVWQHLITSIFVLERGAYFANKSPLSHSLRQLLALAPAGAAALKYVSLCISGQRRLDVSDCFAIILRRSSEASPLECRPIRPLYDARRHANAQVFRFAALHQI